MTPSALRVDVGDLLGRPGHRRSIEDTIVIEGLEISTSHIPDGTVGVDLELEAVIGGLTATGRVEATWVGDCRRCLEPVAGSVAPEVREVFAEERDDPDDPDIWPIEGSRIDLEPVVREAILLALPLAPICRDDCGGPDPERFPTSRADDAGPGAAELRDPTSEGDDGAARGDPRWAALDELRFDD